MAFAVFDENTIGYESLIRPLKILNDRVDQDDHLKTIIEIDHYARYTLSHRTLNAYIGIGPGKRSKPGYTAFLVDLKYVAKKWFDLKEDLTYNRHYKALEGRYTPYTETLVSCYINGILVQPEVMHERGREALRSAVFATFKQKKHKVTKFIAPRVKLYGEAMAVPGRKVLTWPIEPFGPYAARESMDTTGRRLKHRFDNCKHIHYWCIIRDYHLQNSPFWRVIAVVDDTLTRGELLGQVHLTLPRYEVRPLIASAAEFSALLYGICNKHLLYTPEKNTRRLMYYSY